ncbi:MAG TPA: hypothetical protein VFW85_01540 [Gaiellaceae bacterium]|nr:hypothetical protein [Gaiellaceae bacterium]
MDYRAFTTDLVARLEADARVIGAVAAGSMAERDYAPDDWSDHDFLVITVPGVQEEVRSDLSWLPRAKEIAMSFRETVHGMKVIYGDGHMLEFAVVDLEELGLVALNRTRVLFDRGGVQARLDETTSSREQPTDDFLFGMAVTGALVAAGRGRRGETLSAQFFVMQALRHLCALFPRVAPAPNTSVLDDLDGLRRFERVYPELGAELAEIARRSPVDAAAALLDVAERELRQKRPNLAWTGFDAVRARITS